MIKYEYKKPKGCDSKKFIENGHTMFEEDVLSRLNRLAHLEHKLQHQANGVNARTEPALPIQSVISRFSGEERMKLQKHFVSLYGTTEIAQETANSFAVGFGKACDMIIDALNAL